MHLAQHKISEGATCKVILSTLYKIYKCNMNPAAYQQIYLPCSLLSATLVRSPKHWTKKAY